VICMWPTELPSVQTTSKVSDSLELPGVDLRAVVVEWKFTELDANGDRLVDHRELDRLDRLVKKLVRPTSCALNFHVRCDLDFNSSLTPQEWKSCFDDDAETSRRSTANGSCRAVLEINNYSRPVPQCNSAIARFPSKRNRLRCVRCVRCVWMETGLNASACVGCSQ